MYARMYKYVHTWSCVHAHIEGAPCPASRQGVAAHGLNLKRRRRRTGEIRSRRMQEARRGVFFVTKGWSGETASETETGVSLSGGGIRSCRMQNRVFRAVRCVRAYISNQVFRAYVFHIVWFRKRSKRDLSLQ
ncbi:hypothetical protein ABW21_db0209165 [Orbilia brochopaga]|nr:hypothetical protein ABW21_db0209165 [Drechslerella brochopaga]